MKPPGHEEGPIQAESAFLTTPSRRRSATGGAGACAGMQHPAGDAHQHHQCKHSSTATCCSPANHGIGTPAINQHNKFVLPSPGGAAAAASKQPQGLMSSSCVTTRIHAAAICCPMESRLIHNILDSVPGVQSVDVMVVTKMVAVQHDPAAISPAALVAALNSAGLQASLNKHSTSGGACNPTAAGGTDGGSGSICSSGCCASGAGLPMRRGWQQAVQPRGLARLLAALRGNPSVPPLCVLVSALLLVVNLLLLLPGLHAPKLLQKGLLALIAAAVAVPPVLKKAWHGLKNRNLDMNSLVVVALCGAIGLGDWFEAGALVVLFTLAEWLEERCVQRAAGAMEDILKLQPEEALVVLQDSPSEPPQQVSTCCEHAHPHEHVQQEPGQQTGCQQPACCEPITADARCGAGDSTHQHSSCHEEHTGGHAAHDSQPATKPPCCGAPCSSSSSVQPPATAAGCSAHGAHPQHSHSQQNSHSHSELAPAAVPADNSEAGSDQHSCNAHDSACCSHADSKGGCVHKHHHHPHPQAHKHGEACCDKQAHASQQQQQKSQCSNDSHTVNGCNEHSHSCSSQGHKHEHTHGHKHEHTHGHKHEHKHTGCCAHDHHQHSNSHSLSLKSVPLSQLPVGVLVLVRPGDKVPVDGSIEHGSSVLDESMITGESKPVTKARGDSVLAGTVNCGSVALRVRATASAGDSTVARLGALMEQAAASKSRHDMAVELFARYYTPAIVLLALLVAGIGSVVQPAEWRHWTYLSLVVLVTGCPCALVISTPVASVAGLTRAAKKGVLIKGGRPLELLGNLTAASFDKSGTLTEGHFQLTKVHTFGPFSRQQALQLAAMLEQHSNHPIAHAIVGAAAAGGCMSSGGAAGAALQVSEVAGKGLQGSVDGQAVAVGSWGFAQELLAAPVGTAAGPHVGAEGTEALRQQADAAVMAEAKQLLSSADTAGCTFVCLVVQQQLAALLLLSDRARSDALAAVQQLQDLRVKCLMMTGDTMGAAAHVAGQLGIELDDVCAELLPQEKLELIGTLRHRLAAGKARARRQGGPVRRLASWCRGRLQWGAGGGEGGYCSSCGELPGECSCRVALGPDSSSMHRAPSGGLRGSSSCGMRIDANVRVRADDSSGSTRASQGVIIAHVGDGINDAPALAGADVGVAMGVAGAALAVDAADVALFSNNLTSLPFVVRLGRRAARVVAVNTVFACSIKLAVLGAAAAGAASLWLSLLADVGSSLLVTLHALTLLRFEAGQDQFEAASKLYGSRLSGIPLVGELDRQLGGVQDAAAGNGSSTAAGGASCLTQRLQVLLARLPGAPAWLRPYDKLGDRTPAVSAGVSRLTSSNARGGLLGLTSPAAAGPPLLATTGPAAQELREMAILACATTDTTGLLGPRKGSDEGSWHGGRVGAYPVRAGSHFVIDDECC